MLDVLAEYQQKEMHLKAFLQVSHAMFIVTVLLCYTVANPINMPL